MEFSGIIVFCIAFIAEKISGYEPSHLKAAKRCASVLANVHKKREINLK
jgi:hypothetical protein